MLLTFSPSLKQIVKRKNVKKIVTKIVELFGTHRPANRLKTVIFYYIILNR